MSVQHKTAKPCKTAGSVSCQFCSVFHSRVNLTCRSDQISPVILVILIYHPPTNTNNVIRQPWDVVCINRQVQRALNNGFTFNSLNLNSSRVLNLNSSRFFLKLNSSRVLNLNSSRVLNLDRSRVLNLDRSRVLNLNSSRVLNSNSSRVLNE